MRPVIALLLLFVSFTLQAGEAVLNSDPAIEDRFKSITSELRCQKCQNQTIYDSKAGLADDLKRQVRTQIREGKSDQEIIDYMVARYGEFIRYRPEMSLQNMLLWIGPFILFVVGIWALFVQLRKRREMIQDTPLSDDDEKRVQAIINKSGD